MKIKRGDAWLALFILVGYLFSAPLLGFTNKEVKAGSAGVQKKAALVAREKKNSWSIRAGRILSYGSKSTQLT